MPNSSFDSLLAAAAPGSPSKGAGGVTAPRQSGVSPERRRRVDGGAPLVATAAVQQSIKEFVNLSSSSYGRDSPHGRNQNANNNNNKGGDDAAFPSSSRRYYSADFTPARAQQRQAGGDGSPTGAARRRTVDLGSLSSAATRGGAAPHPVLSPPAHSSGKTLQMPKWCAPASPEEPSAAPGQHGGRPAPILARSAGPHPPSATAGSSARSGAASSSVDGIAGIRDLLAPVSPHRPQRAPSPRAITSPLSAAGNANVASSGDWGTAEDSFKFALEHLGVVVPPLQSLSSPRDATPAASAALLRRHRTPLSPIAAAAVDGGGGSLYKDAPAECGEAGEALWRSCGVYDYASGRDAQSAAPPGLQLPALLPSAGDAGEGDDGGSSTARRLHGSLLDSATSGNSAADSFWRVPSSAAIAAPQPATPASSVSPVLTPGRPRLTDAALERSTDGLLTTVPDTCGRQRAGGGGGSESGGSRSSYDRSARFLRSSLGGGPTDTNGASGSHRELHSGSHSHEASLQGRGGGGGGAGGGPQMPRLDSTRRPRDAARYEPSGTLKGERGPHAVLLLSDDDGDAAAVVGGPDTDTDAYGPAPPAGEADTPSRTDSPPPSLRRLDATNAFPSFDYEQLS